MTAREVYIELRDSFRSVSDSPEADARTLLRHILNLDDSRFLLMQTGSHLTAKEMQEVAMARERRLNGEPIAYITGSRGFYENVFRVSKDTLIPRADTETLVESAISDLRSISKRENLERLEILDLCCGTGCIGISVAKVLAREGLRVSLTLSDLSECALGICRQNVENLVSESSIEVHVKLSNLFQSIAGTFDAILSNPPYIRSGILHSLEKQVQCEPRMALDGGADGLDFVRAIAKQSKAHLKEGGTLQLEIGYDQAGRTEELLIVNGFTEIRTLKDLGGNDRVVKGVNK